jgi:serine/threonine protein kinase
MLTSLLTGNNVLINEEGRVQLCDFGVSGALEPEVTKRSTIVGTPNWMAPELKREWVKDIDPSSRARPNEILYGSEVDIWAYGCTLYEMATGLPPFHTTQPFLLPEAGVPRLEGDQYSEELKSLVDFVLQPNPRDRPTPDEILEHPYLADTTKMYPTVTLVALVEQYYRWEQAGGSRISLFNPYGAQAPDPLAPEVEDDDDDWTFSTTDEFERQFASENPDPLSGATTDQAFNGMNVPPQDEDRFARLQASIRQEQAERGKKRLDRLFDTNSTPYRFSAMDPDSQRLSSDLVLRDFNPGAPNRETVIDLDFAAPSAVDVPSIDLGEVPTVKASRINRLMREMDMEDEEEYRDGYDMDQTARRATREWKFPDQSNRKTAEWKFPIMEEPPAPTRAVPEKTNRRTMEWKFDYSSIEANQEPMPRSSRISVRRDTRELNLGAADANRRTQDFVFPMRDPSESTLPDPGAGFSSSPTLEPGFRPTPRHATTEPVGSFDDYPRIESAPNSPLRTSMIDLDMANVDDYRPSTSGSAATSAYTAGGDQMTGNPFDLEDQVQLSETNNRASFHMKSQSEPNHAIPGLLTPQTHDEQGNLTNADPHHPSMHARGVSSASQMQSKPPSINMPYSRQRNQLQPHWDGWNQQEGPNTQQSSPASASPATSAEDEFLAEERWNELEKEALNYKHGHFSGYRHRLTTSQDDDLRSDMEDNYASESSYDVPSSRMSRVSVGPNGRPLVDFPMPRGPDPEALFGVNANLEALSQALLKSSLDMREGLRASRDLLRGMRLADVGEQGNR